MYKIQFDLYENGNKEESGKGDVDTDSYVTSVYTDYIWATNANGDEFGKATDNFEDLKAAKANYDNVMLKPGFIDFLNEPLAWNFKAQSGRLWSVR